MSNIRDLETYKLLKESGEALDKMDALIEDCINWPEEKRARFLKDAEEVLKPIVQALEDLKKITVDPECEHSFGHYENDEYEFCRNCGEKGGLAAKERK